MTPYLPKAIYFGLICLANLVLAVLVYVKNPRHPANRFFALAVGCVSLWTLSNALLHLFAHHHLALLWGRAAFACAALIPLAFLLFAERFRSRPRSLSHWPVVALIAVGVSSSLASFTPYLVTGVTVDSRGLRLTYGALYPAFTLYFLLTFATSFAILLAAYRRATPSARVQLRYLFVGALIGAAGGATTNLIVPLLFKTSSLSWAGPAFSFVALVFIAHAIFRHRLMDIRVALTTSASYGISLAVTGALLAFFLLKVHSLVAASHPSVVALFGLSAGVLLAAAFLPLTRLSQTMLDRYAYRPPYDPPTILEEISSRLPSLLRAEALYAYLDDLLTRTVRPESFLLYLRQGEALHCVRSSALPTASLPRDSRDPISLAAVQKSLDAPLLREEFDAGHDSAVSPLASLSWEALLPLRSPSRAIGFIALGTKRSLDPYYATDIAFLSVLCRQLAIVLENARLYAEATTAKEHLERVLDNMESGVIAVDPRGTIFASNPAAHALLETTSAGLLGMPYNVLPGSLSTQIATVLATNTPIHQHPSSYTTASLRTLQIVTSASPIHVASGPSPNVLGAGAVLVFTDHTRLHELEAERRRAARLLDFQEMAGAIAHEIKNPLVAIKTFAELLPHRFSDQEFRDSFSRLAIHEINRIDSLVDRLRGASMPGLRPLAPVHVPRLLTELTTLLAPQLDRAHLALSVAYSENLPPVAGEPDQLHQLFLNLFLNSIQAMPSGGSVHLAARPSADARTVSVSLADTGPGIPLDLLERIFDPFTSSKASGSGLGLAISRSIVTQHGGVLTVRNNVPEPGVTVVVDLPAWGPHSAPTEHSRATS